MKLNKLFHWLYAAVMMLPLIVIPVFMVYSHRHTIDTYSVQAEDTKVVNFNQPLSNGNFVDSNGWISYYSNLTVVDNNSILVVTSDYNGSLAKQPFYYNLGHTYYLSFYAKTSNSSDIRVGIDLLDSSQTSYQVFGQVSTTNSYNHYSFNFVPYLQSSTGFDFMFRSFGIENTSMYLRDIWLMDLTIAFGEGNEPVSSAIDSYYPLPYYDYVVSDIQLLDIGVVTYNDSDIGSQFIYDMYNCIDKYFNYDKVVNFGALYGWLNTTFFSGAAPLGFFIFWHLLEYWLLTSLLWLLFDVLMYVPMLVHRWLDKASLS